MSHPRVLIVEDHPLMADALRVHLHGLLHQMVCTHAHSLQQALVCLQQTPGFALVMLDLNLPDSQGLNTLHAVCAARPDGALVVLTALDDERVVQACLANNVACIFKSTSSSKLQEALLGVLAKVISAGAPSSTDFLAREAESHVVDRLSSKQRLVLSLMAQGQSSTDIAHFLHLSESTVRTHMADIYQRLGVKNRTQACTQYVLWTQQKGIGDT
ncbi:MAG: hypothetical protein RI998_1368 [Pseudomonadota bacterium]|jgi:DNA-binding NarL/FixJ family response regulator